MWFLDHNYVESMNDMFKKVNAREKLIGWYHSGPKLRASDLQINELFKRYTPNPLLVIVDVEPKVIGVPTDAYFAVEEIKDVRRFCCVDGACVLTLLGWNHRFKDVCPHPIDNRGRGGRGDRCRAPPARHPRCCRRLAIHAHHEPSSASTTREEVAACSSGAWGHNRSPARINAAASSGSVRRLRLGNFKLAYFAAPLQGGFVHALGVGRWRIEGARVGSAHAVYESAYIAQRGTV